MLSHALDVAAQRGGAGRGVVEGGVDLTAFQHLVADVYGGALGGKGGPRG